MHVNYYGISEPPTLESCNFMIRGSFDINLDVLSNFGPGAIDSTTFYGRRVTPRKSTHRFRPYPPLSWLSRSPASYNFVLKNTRHQKIA